MRHAHLGLVGSLLPFRTKVADDAMQDINAYWHVEELAWQSLHPERPSAHVVHDHLPVF